MDLCEREVSPGIQCLEPAPHALRIKDQVTGDIAVIKVCEEHKKQHNRKAAGVRRHRAASKS